MADWEPRPPRTATLAEHNIEFAEFMRKNDRVTTLKPEPPTLPPTPKAPVKSTKSAYFVAETSGYDAYSYEQVLNAYRQWKGGSR